MSFGIFGEYGVFGDAEQRRLKVTVQVTYRIHCEMCTKAYSLRCGRNS